MAKTTILRRQHDSAMELVNEIRELMTGYRGERDAFTLSLRLTKLNAVLRSHFAQEDRYLYPTLMTAGDPQVRETAMAFVDEMGSLGATYEEFAGRWKTSDLIAANVKGFRRDATALFDALETRIERENEVLYPMADQASETAINNAA